MSTEPDWIHPQTEDVAVEAPKGDCAGFTLLEMVTVVAMFSLLVGMGVPVTELFVRQKMLEETREEMEAIRDAVLDYYRDVEAFPGGLVDLVSPSVTPSGWLGPYLAPEFTDSATDLDDYRYDKWRTAYEFTTVSATVRRLRSWGGNLTNNNGASDDITLDINVGVVLGELTRAEVKTINNAIATYNSDFVLSTPLSTTFSTMLGELQAAGYLPSDAASTTKYSTDGWGQAYVTNGSNPVIEVYSPGAP